MLESKLFKMIHDHTIMWVLAFRWMNLSIFDCYLLCRHRINAAFILIAINPEAWQIIKQSNKYLIATNSETCDTNTVITTGHQLEFIILNINRLDRKAIFKFSEGFFHRTFIFPINFEINLVTIPVFRWFKFSNKFNVMRKDELVISNFTYWFNKVFYFENQPWCKFRTSHR